MQNIFYGVRVEQSKLVDLLKPSVESLGYILWGCEYLAQGKHSVLRLYIDKEDGIVLDDCSIVSKQVSQILDVEDPISSNYTLEVSSPGLDRPLFEKSHYTQYIGHIVSLKLYQAINNKKKIQGVIVDLADDVLQLDIEHEVVSISLDTISKANLVS